MICPKCGFEQPDSPDCMRCGIIVARYKGPAVGAGPQTPPPAFAAPAPQASGYSSPGYSPPGAPPYMPPPPVIAGGTALPPSLPIQAAGGGFPPPLPPDPAGSTLYGGPPPSAAGGTLYQGPPPGSVAPTFSSFPVTAGPAFHGTFDTGKVLSETFSSYFSNFLAFFLLNALLSLPLFGLAIYVSSLQHDSMQMAALAFLAAIPLQALVTQLATAGITYGVYQQMRGKDVTVVDCLRAAFSRLLPVLGVAIVSSIAIFGGFLLCIVPGILVSLAYAVAIPVTVEEQPGVFDALRRSSYLTKGFRGQIFGVVFVIGIVEQIPAQILSRVVKEDFGLLLVLLIAIGVLTTSLSATASAVMYYRLRSVKESVDVDQISSVFV